MSKAEKVSWQEKAVQAGIPLSTLIRQAIRKVNISRRTDRGLIAERTCQIRRIGINLNQIAKWANTYKSTAEAIEVIEALQTLEKALNKLIIEESTSFPSSQETGGDDDVT